MNFRVEAVIVCDGQTYRTNRTIKAKNFDGVMDQVEDRIFDEKTEEKITAKKDKVTSLMFKVQALQ